MEINKLKELEKILVKKVMRSVHEGIIDSETSILKVLEVMATEPKRRVFYVVDEDKLIGIITPRMLLEFIALKLGKMDVLRKGEESIGLRFIIGTSAQDYVGKIVACHPDDTLAEATKIMVENLMDEIPVISEDGKLLGELSFIDILILALYKLKSRFYDN